MDENYLLTTTLEAISAIEITPKIITERIKPYFFIKRHNPAFEQKCQNRIKDFVISLKEILGDTPINVLHQWNESLLLESLDKVLLRVFSSDTLLFYLFDKQKDSYSLKAGFSSVKTIPDRVNRNSKIVTEFEKSKKMLYLKDFKNDSTFLKESSIFNAGSFCPIFFKIPGFSNVFLVGFLAIGENLYKSANPSALNIWHSISAAIGIKLMQVADYIKLEAAKQLKEHFESLGYEGSRFDETINFRKSAIKDIDAYRNIKLNLNKLVSSLYGFKEAWKLFEIFSNT